MAGDALKTSVRDHRAVVWTRAGGSPVAMGDVYVTPSEARFSYRADFLASGASHGLGLLYPPTLFGERAIPFRRRDGFDLHPSLNALIPPRDANNFQRRLALAWLRRQGIDPEPGFAEDWAVLMVHGHGGIGHLDLFPDDAVAQAWYAADDVSAWQHADADLGFSLKHYLSWLDDDAGPWLPLVGPTPSVGGMIPKFLVSIPATGWDGRIALPRRGDLPGRTDVILKLEHASAYPGLLDLEALALDLHRRAGFEVPRYWRAQLGELPVLAIERFDRRADATPLPLESLYAVMAAGTGDVTHNHSIPYDRIAAALRQPRLAIVSDVKAAARHLLRRLLLALLSGNGDLHLENLSILSRDGHNAFSPIYDPTPMRAYRRHDILAPMPFGDYGDGADLPEALRRFANALGLRRSEVETELDRLLPLLDEYRAGIATLTSLPTDNRVHLLTVLETVKQRLRP